MARILLLTPQTPLPPAALTGFVQGTTIRNFNLLAGLARSHQVDLASFVAPETGDPREQHAVLAPYCGEVALIPAPTRAQSQRLRDTVLNPLPDIALRLESAEMHARVRSLLASRHYDVIQVEGIEMAQYAGNLSDRPLGGPRVVFDDHNAEYLLQQRTFATDARQPARWLPAGYSLVQWQKLVRYERRVCRAADRIAAVSEADREALLRIAPELAVSVVPNGVDLEFYRPGTVGPAADLGDRAVVFTGKMDYRPNVDAVLWFAETVWPLVRDRAPGARFYVVGQQPHPRLAAMTGDPSIVVTGRVPDVRPYIAGAAAYVAPLRIGGGTRLKILEAMGMASPIVSTRLGCDGFAFTDGEQVRYADAPAAFAAAVLALMEDRRAAGELGMRARRYVEEHYSWDAIVPLMEALYT
jgi:sugar transferase (PEP-CTERM/EpsH1 system associated)